MESNGLQADYVLEGTHLYDPPVGQVLMSDPRAAFFERPMGFYSEELRQGIIDSSARIAGVGGGGLTLAVMLAKEGVRDFSIADIDKVDETNVGRIPMLTPDDIGRDKVDVAAELITKHNPTATVRVYSKGVQEENVEEFLGYEAGNKGITVGFDEIELTEPRVGLLFHRTARKFGRFVIAATDVERGGLVTTFDPEDLENTFEHYNGASPTDTVEQYLKKVKGFQLPTIPNIPKRGAFGTLVASLNDAPLPTTLRSVLNATDLALDEHEKLITLHDSRYNNPHFYPNIHCVNPSQGEDFVSKHAKAHSLGRVLQLIGQNIAGKAQPASYTTRDRKARELYRLQAANDVE